MKAKKYNYYVVHVKTVLPRPYDFYIYDKITKIKREGQNVVFYQGKVNVYRHPMKNLKEIIARHVGTGKCRIFR
jgi:hypothetical protein